MASALVESHDDRISGALSCYDHSCPARFLRPKPDILLGESNGIDSTRFPTFGDVTGAEDMNAMRQDNSVLHSILKLVS